MKNWAKLNFKTKEETVKKIDVFLENPFTSSLKTHKLTGILKDYWSFSVSFNLRILFKFAQKNTIEFIDIGTHDLYR